MRSMTRYAALLMIAAGLWISDGRADAAEIKVLSAGAVRGIVTSIADLFRRETGHTVTITAGTVGVVRQKLAAGEPADVIIVSDTAIDALTKERVVVEGTRADIARTGMGLGVREGAPKPDISTSDALKHALLAAKSIVYVDPAQGATSGIHFASVLDPLGIAGAVKDKTILWPGGFAAEAVAKGDAETRRPPDQRDPAGERGGAGRPAPA